MGEKRIEAWIEEQDATTLLVRTETDGRSKDLFFRSDRAVWRSKFETLDFVLVALSHYASAAGRYLHIRGAVARSQVDHVEEFIQIWSRWRPDLFKRIAISACEYVDVSPGRDMPAAIAYSGGVDASFSLVAHQEKLLGHLSKQVGIGVMAVGWDIKHGDDSARSSALAKARESLNSFGVDCVSIATNWQPDFCPNWILGFNIGVSSVLQTLSNQCSHGIIAGDLAYSEELGIGPHGSHTVVNHLLGSARFPIISTGGTHSRLERVAVLSKYPTLMKNLRVCWQDNADGGNCGVCEKCVRTQLELIANGVDPSICFPGRVTADALSNVHTGSFAGELFWEEILARFPRDHELYPTLCEVVARERAKYRPKETTDAIDGLRACRLDNARMAARLSSLSQSRSWRYTKPLRQMGRVLRGVRSRLRPIKNR
jgi:hypothetical protein